MKGLWVALLLLWLATALAVGDDAYGADPAGEYGDFEDVQGEDDDKLFDSEELRLRWFALRSRVQRALDTDKLVRARRWGNVANGALMAATGPVALTVSLFGLRLSNVVLSLYVTALGGLLASIEMNAAPVTPWVRSNLGYLITQQGRTALLVFMGGLTWPLGKLGAIPALLTCVNAIFNFHFKKLVAFVSEDEGARVDVDGGSTGAIPTSAIDAQATAAAAAAEADAARSQMEAGEAAAAEAAAAQRAAAELEAVRRSIAEEAAAAAAAAGASSFPDSSLESVKDALAAARAAQQQ